MSTTRVPRSGLCVLVVEDDAAIRALVASELRYGLGAEVLEAGDGRAAIDILAKQTPHLVCLDLGLPVVSGYEVCRWLRTQPRTHAIPVVVISGRDTLDDRAWARTMEVADYVAKPFDIKALVARVATLASRVLTPVGAAERVQP